MPRIEGWLKPYKETVLQGKSARYADDAEVDWVMGDRTGGQRPHTRVRLGRRSG